MKIDMWHNTIWWVQTDMLEGCSLSVYRVEVSEDGGAPIPPYVGTYLLNYVRSHHRIQQSSRALLLENSYVSL
jgi:hypothetical protein